MNKFIVYVFCALFLNQCTKVYASDALPLQKCDFNLMPGITHIIDNNDRPWILINGHMYLQDGRTWYEEGRKWEWDEEQGQYKSSKKVNWYNRKEFIQRLYYTAHALQVRNAMVKELHERAAFFGPPPVIGLR